MIVSDVLIRVRRVFGDEAAVQVTDADVIRWINDAQIEIVKHNDSALQKTGFVDTTVNISQYSLPADLFLLKSLRYKTAAMASYVLLTYKSMQQFDESIDGWDGTLYSTGCPEFFTVFENKALVFPTPDISTTAGLKVLYNQKPTDVVTTSDSLALPLIYHNTIWKYCMWQANLLDDDFDSAMKYKDDFSADTGLLQNNETQDATAFYPTITVLDFDQ
jgi:hypothetical protein